MIMLISPTWSHNISECPVQDENDSAGHYLAQAVESKDKKTGLHRC
jgi:hypothetical protein